MQRVLGNGVFLAFLILVYACGLRGEVSDQAVSIPHGEKRTDVDAVHEERATDPWMPGPPVARSCDGVYRPTIWPRGPYKSVQVNVDACGGNIFGDAANEPSIAIDPTDPTRIVIGWRQFDTVESGFRQAGWAYTHDGGVTWTFPGVLAPGVFGSDPVLAADAEGNIYYHSIRCPERGCGGLYKSRDGGVSWSAPVPTLMGDKPWMAIDRTEGIGRGNIYFGYRDSLSRSVDGGATFQGTYSPSGLMWGTMSIAPDGSLYTAASGLVSRSSNAQDPNAIPVFELSVEIDFGGLVGWTGTEPNPGGLIGQSWVATDHSQGLESVNVYTLAATLMEPAHHTDAIFVRSTDRGVTWSEPVRINDDPEDSNAWQWFAMLSVAPNGRIDAVWNDTRALSVPSVSELFYAFSVDDGLTWSKNVPVSPRFSSHIGWPQNNKLGDYYDMISDNAAANVAYAATFNGEQDVYFIRIGDCNDNGVHDAADIAGATSEDVNDNGVPDECDADCNDNGIPDDLDIAAGTSNDDNGNGVPDECQTVLFVDTDAEGPVHNGSTWERAYTNLQDALIRAASSGGIVTELWVAAGVYKPDQGTGNRSTSFNLFEDLAIYGGFAGTETSRDQRDSSVNVTVLSGDLEGNDVEVSCTVNSPDCDSLGQLCIDGSCLFKQGSDQNSYHVLTANYVGGTAILDGFTITGGFADGGDQGYLAANHNVGGGLRIIGGNPRVVDCRFIGNEAANYGGGIYAAGAHLTVVNSVFADNSAANGGGISTSLGDASYGDALVTGCLFNGNVATGGAMFTCHGCLATLINCILTNNMFRALYSNFGAISMSSTIAWANTKGSATGLSAVWNDQGTLTVDYSCIQGWDGSWGGVGNTGADPLFIDLLGPDGTGGTLDDDLRLSPDSALINVGDPGFVGEVDATDLDGNPRLQGCRVDLGAYEANIGRTLGDFDGNNRFDLADIAGFQACIDASINNPTWLAPCLCAFDYDDNSQIDLDDFKAFHNALANP